MEKQEKEEISKDKKSSIENLYQMMIQDTEDRVRWYQIKKIPKRFGSRFLRGMSIAFGAMGFLCPLLEPIDIFRRIDLTQWGYVAFAIAAALIAFDRLFGISSGWMRFTLTQMKIESALKQFRYDWHIKTRIDLNDEVTLINMLKDFGMKIESLIQQETEHWIKEFNSSIRELEKEMKGNSKISPTGK